MQTSGNTYGDKSNTYMWIDHPNTTSATTYKWQGKVSGSGPSVNMYFHHSYGIAQPIKTMAVEINSGQSINWT